MTQESVCKKENRFMLISTSKEGSQYQVEINYEQLGRSNGNIESIIPTFNKDKLFFTPAFFIPADKKYHQQNETFEKFKFKEKIERNLELLLDRKETINQDNIKLAPPSTNFCQICKQKYQDYFTHTNLEAHLRNVHKNPTNLLIQDLCDNFSEQSFEDKTKVKSKGIKKPSRNQRGIFHKEKKIPKNKTLHQGQQCFGRSGGQSTGVGQKDGEIQSN